MNGLLTINYETEQPTVSARDLHKALEIKSNFTTWFARMSEYGFESGKDFFPKMEESIGGRPATDSDVSIDMAKQICMIQRNEKGRQYRQYFLDLEKAWNTPEQIFACALKMADQQIEKLKANNLSLMADVQRMKPQRSICGCGQRVKYLHPDRGTGEDTETERCGHRTEQTVHMDA